MFGGRIRFFVTGSAPLSKELANEIKVVFGLPIVEAYGMTEVGGGSIATGLPDPENGHLGGPIRQCLVKLEEVPEMGYTAKTEVNGEVVPAGEICMFGPINTPGYFRKEKETKELIDEEGWLHSGDVGIYTTDGRIKIIDRKKEIFKLAQGEYIAPTKLEAQYVQSEYVTLVVVYGDSYHSNLIGIIVPERKAVIEFLQKQGIQDLSVDNVVDHFDNEKLHKELKDDFAKIHKEKKFNGLERVEHFILAKEEFNHDKNELLTPSFKVIRKKVREFFQKEIDEIYAKIV